MPGFTQQAGWSQAEFDAITKAAEDGFAAGAQVRRVLPEAPPSADRYHVTSPKVGGTGTSVLTIDTTASLTPVRIASKLVVRSEQLQDVALVQQLARKAGQIVGLAESALLAHGTASAAEFGTIGPTDVTLDALASATQISAVGAGADQSAELETALVNAIAKLHGEGHPGPFAFVATPGRMARFGSLTTSSSARARLAQLLGEELATAVVPRDPVAAAAAAAASPPDPPPELAFLISLASRGVDLATVDPLSVSQLDITGGDLTLQVEERLVLRILDATAIVKIT